MGKVLGMRAKSLVLLGLLLVAVLVGRNLLPEEASQPATPAPLVQEPADWKHIFLIVVDTLRRDHVSLYGDALRTPNMERLAAEGQVFDAATASFHQTTMSMAALFTGRTPSLEKSGGGTLDWNGKTWCGLARMAQGDLDPCIPWSLPTLAEGMRAAGYRTIGILANELLYRPGGFERGFDEWVEIAPVRGKKATYGNVSKKISRLRSAPAVNAELLRVLDEQPTDEPLFVYLHYIDVHEYAVLRQPYAKMISSFDTHLGELLDELEARDMLSDTLIVLTSDHGEALGEEHALPSSTGHIGNPSFQPVLDIPLITSRPIPVPSGTLLRSQDLFDLLLRLAGGKTAGPQDVSVEEIFTSEHSFQTYRNGRWKSTRSRLDGALALFDLEADPGETIDVSARHPEIAAEHERRLDEITIKLANETDGPQGLSPYDEERLRRLGYIE
jgi:arylsulfatase A-like enzyme